jgi:betaine-aldehyde dehydrogenase
MMRQVENPLRAKSYRQWIDGAACEALSGERFTRESPAHDVIVGDYPLADAADTDRAVAAARKAFDSGPWPRMSGAERSRILHRAANLIEAHREELVLADVLEGGKPITQVRAELSGTIDLWRYAAGQARAVHGESNSGLGRHMLGLTTREPAGVVALITPWNFPFVIVSQKLPFALAAGCTTVVKPSELTPGSTLRLGELLHEAGVPAGVVNIVVGYGNTVGQRLAEHPDVDMISFTGSTAVGKGIVRASAGNLKRVALELGGKNPQIVCADADLDAAADAVVFGVFFNAGQCCNSSSRLLVEKSISEDFLERVDLLTRRVVVGDPLMEETKVGAIVNRNQMERILGFVSGARDDGACLRTGGGRIETERGLFMAPTVVSGVTPDMAIARDEVFGPVLSALTFENLDEAISLANATHYGLSAGIWTASYESALRAGRELSAGTVWVNCWMDGFPEMPFGGMRESGIGREQGRHAVEDFMETKSVLFHQGPRTGRWVPALAVHPR